MSDEVQRYYAMLRQAQAFMPHHPLGARDRVRSILRELQGVAWADGADGKALRATAQGMLAEYQAAADAFQAANVRRAEAHVARERVSAGKPHS